MVATISAGVVGLTLLVAGMSKLTNRSAFEAGLAGVSPLPASAGPLLAILVPAVELILAAMLLFGLAVQMAAAAAAALFLIFTVVVARVLLRRERVSCACFGSASPDPLGWSAVGRNGLLIAVSLAAVVIAPSPGTRVPATLCAALLLVCTVLVAAYRRSAVAARGVTAS